MEVSEIRLERRRKASREYMRRKRAATPAEMREKARKYAAVNRQKPERQEYMREYLKRYYQENREKYWGYRGVKCTQEIYDTLLTQQDNKCAICAQEATKEAFAVDHEHSSGRIRGLLCKSCNLVIGNAKDDPCILYAGIAYLRKVSN